jgi:Glucosamine 6-phosphate synthetase, contains amidotransferase and phosphosugar isomerase domains
MTSVPGALMRAEIADQPRRWADLADLGRGDLEAAAALIRDRTPELMVFIARGSSDHAAQYGQYLAHNLLGIPGQLATPGTTTVYHREVRYPASVGLAISQSGESPDLLETVRAVQAAGVAVVGLANNPDSTLARLVDVHVDLHAGVEQSVAATKTYTAELLALYLLLGLASGSEWTELAASVAGVAAAAEGLIAAELAGPGLIGSLVHADKAMVIGRGYSMATAKEGALKLMETSRISASGWSATDATHGPLGQVVAGLPVIGFTSDPASRPSVVSFLSAAERLGAEVTRVEIECPWPELTPLLDVIPVQVAALRTSLAKGLDPDVPAGLAKVTQTL